MGARGRISSSIGEICNSGSGLISLQALLMEGTLISREQSKVLPVVVVVGRTSVWSV
jgi:hypothetical protein